MKVEIKHYEDDSGRIIGEATPADLPALVDVMMGASVWSNGGRKIIDWQIIDENEPPYLSFAYGDEI